MLDTVITRYPRARHIIAPAMLDSVLARPIHLSIRAREYIREPRSRIFQTRTTSHHVATRYSRLLQTRTTLKYELRSRTLQTRNTVANTEIRNTVANTSNTTYGREQFKHASRCTANQKIIIRVCDKQYILVLRILVVSVINFVALTRCITDLTFCREQKINRQCK